MEPSDWITRATEIMYWALLGIVVQYDPIQPMAEPSSMSVMSFPPMRWIAVLAIRVAVAGSTNTSTGVPTGNDVVCLSGRVARFVVSRRSERKRTTAPATIMATNAARNIARVTPAR